MEYPSYCHTQSTTFEALHVMNQYPTLMFIKDSDMDSLQDEPMQMERVGNLLIEYPYDRTRRGEFAKLTLSRSYRWQSGSTLRATTLCVEYFSELCSAHV